MQEDRKKRTPDDPDARLALVLMRYLRGWWEQAKLAAAARLAPSAVSMWDRGDRTVPRSALERTADATGVPRYLLNPMLRMLRSFRLAALRRPKADRVLAEVFTAELFPLAGEALDLILDPLKDESADAP